jgi:HEAT repeat protein
MQRRSTNKARAKNLIARLNGRSSVEVYEAAKEIWERDDPRTQRAVIRTLNRGKRAMNRAATAYALDLMHGRAAIAALERTVQNKQEHPKVRGQAAEALAGNHRASSHRLLIQNLQDPSKDVRFWCAYALAEMGDSNALAGLRKLAKEDQRIVRGFWSVSREANWAIRKIRDEVRRRGRKGCWFCTKALSGST